MKNGDEYKDNPHENHRSRLRERFRNEGFKNMDSHIVLELLLFYAIPRADTNITAHKLIEHFGSLSAVLDAPEEELLKIPGIGKSSALFIKMLPQLFSLYTADKLEATTDYSDINSIGESLVQYFLPKTTECVVLIFFSGDKVLRREEYNLGMSDMTDINLRRIAKSALASDATGFIIAHNHPHGKAKSSQTDIATTVNMMNIFGNLGITLREHIIVSGNEYYCLLKNLTDDIFTPGN